MSKGCPGESGTGAASLSVTGDNECCILMVAPRKAGCMMQLSSTLPLLLLWCPPRRRCSVYMGPSAVQPVQFRQHRKGSEWNMAPGVIRGAIEGNIRKSHLNALQTGCGSDAAFGTPPDMDVPSSVVDRPPHQPSQPPMHTVRGNPHTFHIRGPRGIVMRYLGIPLPEYIPEAIPGPYESLPGGQWPGHGQNPHRGHQRAGGREQSIAGPRRRG